jgi:hypothetical protein
VPNRAAPTKTFITVFIANSMLGAVSKYLQNAEYKDCGLGLRNGTLVNWESDKSHMTIGRLIRIWPTIVL